MKILIPSTSMVIKPGTTIPEVDTEAGEVAWTAGTYAVDDLRVYNGSVYSCVKEHTSTSDDPTPDKDPTRWLFKEPSNRMRPFDEYMYTKASKPGSLTYVLSVPFASGFAIHGVEAGNFHFVYRDAPTVEYPEGVALVDVEKSTLAQARGLYQLLFRRSSLQRINKWTSPRLPLRPMATAEITLSNSDTLQQVSVGWIGLGHWHEIRVPRSDVGATQQGVEWTPRTTAKRKDRGDGTYTRTRGLRSKVTSGSAIFDAEEMPRISALLEQCMDTLVAVDFCDMPKYEHLSGVGFLTGTVTHESFNHCTLNFTFDSNV